MNTPRIVIFSDNTGWHEQRLQQAFSRRGADSRVASLGDCRLEAGGSGCAPRIPGFDDAPPDAAFVRTIAGGSFEQVTFRLDILHALQETGVLVYNPARAIERTVDKGMTSFLLARAGIPAPPFWVCGSLAEARRTATRESSAGRRLVLKPLFGNCGRGLLLLEAADDLPAEEAVESVYYLQSFVERAARPYGDWRVFVIGDRAVAAMERISDHWITNRARGARCLPAVLSEPLRNLAQAAAAAAGTSYAGIDIVRDSEGRYLVLEVNSVPAWRGLQSVHAADIAELLAADLLDRLLPLRRPSAAL